MHVQFTRTVLAFLGLGLGSGLFAQQQQQQEFPTYRQLKEEQRIILNAYLVRGEMTYLTQAKAQFADNNLRSAKQNTLTAILLLSRAKGRMDMHPTSIEQARNAVGFRLSEDDRKELRESLHNDIDPRYFSLQTALEAMAGKFAAKGDRSVQSALRAAESGDVGQVINIIENSGFSAEKDNSGLKQLDSEKNRKPGSGPGSDSTTGASPMAVPGLPGATAVQSDPSTVTVNVPGVGTITAQGTLDPSGRYLDTPDAGRVDLSTIHKDAAGNIIAMSDKGPVYYANGKWNLGTPPGAQQVSTRTQVATKPPMVDGVEVSDSDLQDGVMRKYIGQKGGLLVSEQKIALAKNADGTPKVDASGNLSLSLGERRTWKFRLNLGEQKSVGGGVQQTLGLVEDGGSTAFTVSGWEIVSSEGARAGAESRGNGTETQASYPRNGTYSVTVSGKTDWGSAFRYRAEVPVFQ